MARRRRRRRGGVGKELCLQSAAFNVKFNIKASLEAVFVAVLDVLPVGLALHAHLHVVGQVGELHGHQRLQVPRLQELPVVGVVLQGKARVAAHPVVIHCADFVCVFLSLGSAVHRDEIWVVFCHNLFREAPICQRLRFEADNSVELDEDAWFAIPVPKGRIIYSGTVFQPFTFESADLLLALALTIWSSLFVIGRYLPTVLKYDAFGLLISAVVL